LDDLYLSDEVVDLKAGDRLVFYTDGLVDAMTADGRSFELDGLRTALQPGDSLAPDVLCSTVFDTVYAHQEGAEQFDDMTMLVVEVK
jgi:sigma-B regulation protein RsbU (phosphoserine phosphatase)